MAGRLPAPYPFSSALEASQPVGLETEMGETMMLGMRLTGEGVREAEFRGRFGVGIAERYPSELQELSTQGLIETTEQRVRLSRSGRLLANRVFRAFI
jgi:oxygen-independent coproporphyrinogen-3 oxidase